MSSEPGTHFSTSGEDIIKKTIAIHADESTLTLSPSQFDDFYDIERTAAEILSGDYKRVISP
jgi:diphthamide biosynthesis protein 2